MLCLQCRRAAARGVARSASALRATTSALFPTSSPVTTARQQSSLARVADSRSISQRTTQSVLRASPSLSSSWRTYSTVPSSSTTPAKPDYLDEAESQIWDKLAAEFSPSELSVKDVSGGCGSMYGIEIASEKFRGTTMLKQQRMVNAVLGEQLKGWHGVQLRTKVPKA